MGKLAVKQHTLPSKSTLLIFAGTLCVIVCAALWMKDLLSVYDMTPEACPDTSVCLERLYIIESMLKVYWGLICVGIIAVAVGFYIKSRPKPPVKKRRT